MVMRSSSISSKTLINLYFHFITKLISAKMFKNSLLYTEEKYDSPHP